MSAGHVILSANDSTPQANLGQIHVNFDLEGLLGPRSYLYVRNHDSSAWTKGLNVRQRTDLFSTEGTALTADTSGHGISTITDATTPGAPWTTTDGYVPDTLNKVLYWNATHSPSANYAGRVWRSNTDVDFNLQDLPAVVIGTGSGVYTIWKPYTFIVNGIGSVIPAWGVTQSAISAGYYGWVQFAGFGYLYAGQITSDVAVSNGLGIIPAANSGATAGYGQGYTAGTNDGLIYAIALVDNATTTPTYMPAMIRCPATIGLSS